MSSDTRLKSLRAQYLIQARTIDNPLWSRVLDAPEERLLVGYGRTVYKRGWNPAQFDWDTYASYRDECVSRYAWAIPAPEVLAELASEMDTRGCVEIGAGSGYWAWLLSQLGIDVAAYDVAPIGYGNTWFNGTVRGRPGDFEPEQFHPVHQGGPEVLEYGNHANQVLFLCWPTMDSWAYEAAQTYQGDTIAYVGESGGGCTASGEFFRYVGEDCGCWSSDCDCGDIVPAFAEERTVTMPQWGGIHDNLTIYRRTTQ